MRRISRREFIGGAVALGAGWALLPRLARANLGGGGVWLAGDLHCHTVYSHDVWTPNDPSKQLLDVYTWGWTPGEQIAIAETRALDFLAITDHDDVRALTDPGYHSDKLTLLRGYEHSLSKGHAGCLGVTHVMIDPLTGQKIDTSTEAGATKLRDAVHAEDGIFILNHPFYSKNESQSWRYSVELKPDSIEVWNIGWPWRGSNAIASTSNNYKSLGLWETYLSRWARMPATGGSDNHWRSTTAVQGVGQPTTWVYAADRSAGAILAAIVAGRTTVSAEPPGLGGARVFLTAEAGGVTYGVGDTVPAGAPVTVVARVLNAPGHLLQLVVDGAARAPVPVTLPDFTLTETLTLASRVRAEVYAEEGYWMAALSSPIYAA